MIIITDIVHPLAVQGLMSQLSQPLSVRYVAPNTDVTTNKLNKNNEEDQASVYPHSPQVSILISYDLKYETKSLSTSGLVEHILLWNFVLQCQILTFLYFSKDFSLCPGERDCGKVNTNESSLLSLQSFC